MMRRRGGRGIVGTMATTAVVAGTAGAVHHRQEARYQNNAMDETAGAGYASRLLPTVRRRSPICKTRFP